MVSFPVYDSQSIVLPYIYRVVKKSSYRLNSIILVGVFVGFVGTLLHVIQLDSDMSQTSAAIVCNVKLYYISFKLYIATCSIQVRYWMTELAFVVCFATFFVKIWRLYKVFFNKRMTELVRKINFLIMFSILMIIQFIELLYSWINFYFYEEILGR